jgi:hypothetical protein
MSNIIKLTIIKIILYFYNSSYNEPYLKTKIS